MGITVFVNRARYTANMELKRHVQAWKKQSFVAELYAQYYIYQWRYSPL